MFEKAMFLNILKEGERDRLTFLNLLPVVREGYKSVLKRVNFNNFQGSNLLNARTHKALK